MMKSIFFSILLFSGMLLGCEKDATANAINDKQLNDFVGNLSEQEQEVVYFSMADTENEEYLDELDDTETTKERAQQILCKEYPEAYKKSYMPFLQKMDSEKYTDEKLLSDLNSTISNYKSKLNIRCN